MEGDPIVIPPFDPTPVPPPPPVGPPVTLQAVIVQATRKIVAFGLFPAGVSNPLAQVIDLDESLRATLEQPGEKVLNLDGTITVTPPPPPEVIQSIRQSVEKTVTTTTAAATELWGYDLPETTIYDVRVLVIAIDRNNGDTKKFVREATIRRLTGAPSVVGAVLTPTPDQPASGAQPWTMTPAFVGNRLTFTIVGQVGKTVDWTIYLDAKRFSRGGV